MFRSIHISVYNWKYIKKGKVVLKIFNLRVRLKILINVNECSHFEQSQNADDEFLQIILNVYFKTFIIRISTISFHFWSIRKINLCFIFFKRLLYIQLRIHEKFNIKNHTFSYKHINIYYLQFTKRKFWIKYNGGSWRSHAILHVRDSKINKKMPQTAIFSSYLLKFFFYNIFFWYLTEASVLGVRWLGWCVDDGGYWCWNEDVPRASTFSAVDTGCHIGENIQII